MTFQYCSRHFLWVAGCYLVLKTCDAYLVETNILPHRHSDRHHQAPVIEESLSSSFTASATTHPSVPNNSTPRKNNNAKFFQETINKQDLTLYAILGAPSTATREELKKRYVELAKLSHPDARITKRYATTTMVVPGNAATTATATATAALEIIPEFGEIAKAWRVLGDSKSRKRYDRDLAAKAWTEAAQKFTDERLEEAIPAMLSMIDNFAVPFLRQTTATTVAVGRAIAENLQTYYGTTNSMMMNKNNINKINNNNNRKYQNNNNSTFGYSNAIGVFPKRVAHETTQEKSNNVDFLDCVPFLPQDVVVLFKDIGDKFMGTQSKIHLQLEHFRAECDRNSQRLQEEFEHKFRSMFG